MLCNKQCKCNDCEMLQPSHILFVDDSNFMNETRVDLQGFKCLYHGGYALNLINLKNKQFDDNIVYGDTAIKVINDFYKSVI